MTMIPASAAASATASLPFDHENETAACVFAATELLLPHLERGQRIDAATLRGAMKTAFDASDAAGAWGWKTAYEACEAATVLFLRKYGKALFHKASSPVVMRQRLTAYGLFHKIISWKLRMFVPVDASGPTVLGKLFDRWPVERIGEREAA